MNNGNVSRWSWSFVSCMYVSHLSRFCKLLDQKQPIFRAQRCQWRCSGGSEGLFSTENQCKAALGGSLNALPAGLC